jgi:hypothetical protein
MMDRMAATFGPACGLPRWIQFLRFCAHAHKRKNWMFYGSDTGGPTAAVLTSTVASSKRLHINPFAHLRDVFERISSHPKQSL